MGWDPSQPGALIGEESWGRFRGHLRTYAIFALLLLAVALGASVVALVDHARDAPLRDGGLQAEARVLDAHERQRGADLIEVVFTDHEGELRHGRIPVVDSSEFEPGASVTVVYDPTDPDHVDVASGGSPLWRTALMVAVGTAIVTAWVGVRRSQLRRRVHRAVADGTSTSAWTLHVTAWRWSTRQHWVFVWPTTPDGDPDWAIELFPDRALAGADTAPRQRTVVGPIERRRAVVPLGPDGTAWWPKAHLRKPPRSVRRARDRILSAAAVHVPAASADEPAEPSRGRRWGAVVVVLVTVANFALVGYPLFVDDPGPEEDCPGPPAIDSSAPAALPPLERSLLDELPVAMPGPVVTPLDVAVLDRRFRDDLRQDLDASRFEQGIAHDWEVGTGHVGISALDFVDADGARRFETSRWMDFCQFRFTTFDTGWADASGVTFPRQSGGYQHRIVYQQGSRLYRLQHDASVDDPSLLLEVLANQRALGG